MPFDECRLAIAMCGIEGFQIAELVVMVEAKLRTMRIDGDMHGQPAASAQSSAILGSTTNSAAQHDRCRPVSHGDGDMG